MKFKEVCGLICMFAGFELSVLKNYQLDKPLELENRRICMFYSRIIFGS